MTKVCANPSCAQQNPQPLSNFYKRKKTKCGLNPQCKMCSNVFYSAWRLKNREKILAKERAAYARTRQAKCEKSRGCRFSQKYWPHLGYRAALAEWNKMFKEQNGLCSICKQQKPLQVEHDHITMVIRSLACNGCNTALGYIKENFDTALNLAKYIQEHKGAI